MLLATEDIQKLQNAAEKAGKLIEAFKYVIHAPDSHRLTRDECTHVASLIDPIRKEVFWDKFRKLEPGAAKEGFFARYIRTSSQHYKPKDYSQQFKTISNWLEKARHRTQRHPASNVDKVEIKEVFSAIFEINTRLMIDGGKNAFRIFQHNEKDRQEVRKKAGRADQAPDDYIDTRNRKISAAAIFHEQSVEEYLKQKNEEVDRRKDVLQVFTVELSSSIKEIQTLLYPQMPNICATENSAGQQL